MSNTTPSIYGYGATAPTILPPLPVNGPDIPTDDQRTIAALQRQLDQANELLRSTQADVREYASKWATLNEFINEAADDNDLCGKYDEAIEAWSDSQPAKYHLDGRFEEEAITISYTVSSRRPRHAEDLHTAQRYFADHVRDAVTDYLHSEDHQDVDVHI